MELKGRVVVYSIVGCPHCMRAKNILSELGVPYVDVGVDKFPDARNEMKQKSGRSTVPQIFFNSHHVGGNEDLQKVVEDKEAFAKLIEMVKENDAPSDAPSIPDPSTAEEGGTFDIKCEPDEYARLVDEIKQSGIIKNNRRCLIKSYKNSFTGKEFVDWYMTAKGQDKERAIEVGQNLIDQHFGNQVKQDQVFKADDTLYQLLEDQETNALNAGETTTCQPRPVSEIGDALRKLILKIYAAFLSPDGKKVDYAGIGKSAEFTQYKQLAHELTRVQVKDASREDKLAFFINIYNALVVHGNIEWGGAPSNLWQRYKFFNTVQYVIGGHTYSLQDIENGVLRGNRKGVGQFSVPFKASDPRAAVALETAEPLIHFALVCGAKSCPPIKTYSSENIHEGLQLAAEAFLEGDDGIQINMASKQVKLSKIFHWYRVDFGKNDCEVLETLLSYMGEGNKKEQLSELLAQGIFKILYMPYDWGVNSK